MKTKKFLDNIHTIQKRKERIRKRAEKVFEEIVLSSEILEVKVEQEVDRNEMVSIKTGFVKVTFRCFQQP